MGIFNSHPKTKPKVKRSRNQSLEQKADSMQMVLPRIYMGSAVASKDLVLLQNAKVTHIVAIGWNLQCHYPSDFEYLLLNKVEDRPSYIIIEKFSECFNFMDKCLNSSKSANLFVHCHKGLSRSATIIIAYEMYKHRKPFKQVLHEMRDHRSFIMPNIGFQAQLQAFEDNNYSVNLQKDYINFNVLQFISHLLPEMLKKIKKYYNAFKNQDNKNIDDHDLFSITMYIHQVHKLREKKKLNDGDVEILVESINYLRKIQVEFVQDEASINRFNIMFAHKEKPEDFNLNENKNENVNEEKKDEEDKK